jgi:hypothetical protein
MDCFNILALFARLFPARGIRRLPIHIFGWRESCVCRRFAPRLLWEVVYASYSKTWQDFRMECIHIDENLVNVNSRYSIWGFPFTAQGSADKRVQWWSSPETKELPIEGLWVQIWERCVSIP